MTAKFSEFLTLNALVLPAPININQSSVCIVCHLIYKIQRQIYINDHLYWEYRYNFQKGACSRKLLNLFRNPINVEVCCVKATIKSTTINFCCQLWYKHKNNLFHKNTTFNAKKKTYSLNFPFHLLSISSHF